MPRELIIPPTRFRAAMTPNSPIAVWESERITLMYPYANRPVGSDRAVEFTVNGFLRMVYNTPVPIGGILEILPSLDTTYAGGAGAANEPPTPITTSTVQPSIASIGYTLAPIAPQVVTFPQFQNTANLGQTAFLRVVFKWGRGIAPIDVTFTGAIVSSDLAQSVGDPQKIR